MCASIVQTVLALAAALGMQSIAEGVETEEQAAALRGMKCESGQGYLWSRPVDAARAFALLSARAPKSGAPEAGAPLRAAG
jgi:EAL domain-containing protein (putative c-di-GMP-specific phosphodiesterase class I)